MLFVTLHNMGFDFKNQGRYMRQGHSVYKRKEFNPDKRKWSFHCGFCGKKVSSDVDRDYFYIADYDIRTSGTISDRCCSEVCARHVWDEMLEVWLKNHGYPTNLGLENGNDAGYKARSRSLLQITGKAWDDGI